MNILEEGNCPSRAMAPAGLARNCALVGSLLLAVALPATRMAAQDVCSGKDMLVLSKSGSPHGGISCTNVSDFSILLEDGAVISTTEGRGVSLTGGGNISITTRPDDGYSRIVSDKDMDTQPERSHHAISVAGSNSASPGNLNIEVTDVWALGEGADGIRVFNYRGDINITSTGTVRVDGTKPAFGVLVDIESLSSPNSSGYSTTVRVHNIISHAGETDISNSDVAALRILSSGGATVVSTGHIRTIGDYSHGVHVDQYIKPNTNDPISITVNDVTTEGTGSYGIIVNTVNFNSNLSKINVLVKGRVDIKGDASHGVAIGALNSDVSVEIAETGAVIVESSGGPDDPLQYAVIVHKEHASQPVQSATLTNLGLIDGNVWLESHNVPVFTNRGTFRTHQEVRLPKANGGPNEHGVLRNYGTISFGSKGSTTVTTMTGNLELHGSSTLEIDIDWRESDADKLTVTGSAELNGRLLINSISLPTATQKLPILEASDGIAGTTELTVRNSLFLTYSLEHEDAQSGSDTLFVSASFDPEPDGLNRNQRNVLAELTNSVDANRSIESAYLQLINHTEIEVLRFDLDSFGNEVAGAAIQSVHQVSLTAADLFPACRQRKDAISPRNCGWVVGEVGRKKRPRVWEQRGFSETGFSLGTGITFLSDDSNIRGGLGVVLSRSRLSLDTFSRMEGSVQALAGHVAGKQGGLEYAVSATMGRGSHDVARDVPVGGSTVSSTGRMSSRSIGIQGAAKVPISAGGIRAAPIARMNFVRVKSDPYREDGAGDLSLNVHSTATDLVTAGIGMEVRPGSIHVSGFSLAPSFKGFLNRQIKGKIDVNSDFRGGTGSFLSTTRLPPTTLDLESSWTFLSRSGDMFGHLKLKVALAEGARILRSAIAGNFVFQF